MDEKISDIEKRLSQEGISKKDNQRFLNKMDWYFRPKSFERNGKLYEALGIKKFKRIAISLGKGIYKLVKQNPKWVGNNYFLWDKSKEGLKKFEYKTRFNEAIHLVPMVGFAHLAVNSLLEGNYGLAALDVGSNLAFGIYPVLLQRYNRARLYNVTDEVELREKKSVQ